MDTGTFPGYGVDTNAEIMGMDTFGELADFCLRRHRSLNAVNIATACSCCVSRIGGQKISSTMRQDAMQAMDCLLARAGDVIREFRAQGIVVLMWTLATLGVEPPGELMSVMSSRLASVSGELEPKEVMVLKWALATLGLEPAVEPMASREQSGPMSDQRIDAAGFSWLSSRPASQPDAGRSGPRLDPRGHVWARECSYPDACRAQCGRRVEGGDRGVGELGSAGSRQEAAWRSAQCRARSRSPDAAAGSTAAWMWGYEGGEFGGERVREGEGVVRRGNAPAPGNIEINKRLMRLGGMGEIASLCIERVGCFNVVNIATASSSMAKLARCSGSSKL